MTGNAPDRQSGPSDKGAPPSQVNPALIGPILSLLGLVFALVMVQVLLVSDLVTGERVELRCDAEGGCELRRARAIGPFHTVGRFPESGVVGSSDACRSEYREDSDYEGPIDVGLAPTRGQAALLLVGDFRWVQICQPGLWVIGWDGPPLTGAPAAAVRGSGYSWDEPLPGTAAWVDLSAREHEGWDLSPYPDIDRRRASSTAWSVRYSSARWASYPTQLYLAGLYFSDVIIGSVLIAVNARRSSSRQ